jgi:hypothetical protein
MSRWFRSYADKHRNPKVAKLSDADFRLWDQMLCIASENEGVIPPAEDLKHVLNRRLDHLSSALKRLVDGQLIDALSDGYAPRNWDEKQYKSDTSTPRVQAFRAKRNVSGNVSETPPETDTETDSSVDKSTGGAAADPVKELFDVGVSVLTSAGSTEKQARSLIGKWRKDNSDGEVLTALIDCRTRAIAEPVEWLTKRFSGTEYVSASGYRYRGDDRTVMREAEKRADWSIYWKAKGNMDRGGSQAVESLSATARHRSDGPRYLTA